MSSRYTGKVTERRDVPVRAKARARLAEADLARPREREFTVNVGDGPMPELGTNVEVRVILSDEEIGRKLRTILTVDIDDAGRENLREVADEIDNQLGWGAISELIRDVAGL